MIYILCTECETAEGSMLNTPVQQAPLRWKTSVLGLCSHSWIWRSSTSFWRPGENGNLEPIRQKINVVEERKRFSPRRNYSHDCQFNVHESRLLHNGPKVPTSFVFVKLHITRGFLRERNTYTIQYNFHRLVILCFDGITSSEDTALWQLPNVYLPFKSFCIDHFNYTNVSIWCKKPQGNLNTKVKGHIEYL